MLETDVSRLQQLLMNLLSNAAKFTNSGSITLSLKKDFDNVYFVVSDTGCGISDENKKKLFGRYEKLNENEKGTGLGLHISKLIANKLCGKLYLDESYSGGAKFVLVHPLRILTNIKQ